MARRAQHLRCSLVGLQPTVIASRAPHLLLEQSVMIRRIVDVHRPSNAPLCERSERADNKLDKNFSKHLNSIRTLPDAVWPTAAKRQPRAQSQAIRTRTSRPLFTSYFCFGVWIYYCHPPARSHRVSRDLTCTNFPFHIFCPSL